MAKTPSKTSRAAKKTIAPKKKTSKPAAKKPVNAALIKKLTDTAKKLDKEKLEFLIKQAQVFEHNMKVEELNKERRQIVTEYKPIELPKFDKTAIEVVEGKDMNHFILVVNNSRNFFSRDEMRKLAKICQNAANEKDGAANLYGWFKSFRTDVINDTKIDGPDDASLVTMYKAIKERYTSQ